MECWFSFTPASEEGNVCVALAPKVSNEREDFAVSYTLMSIYFTPSVPFHGFFSIKNPSLSISFLFVKFSELPINRGVEFELLLRWDKTYL
jgi:hypothetical protein